MKKATTVSDLMKKHRIGATELSARTGLMYNSCKGAKNGRRPYPVLDRLAPALDFALEKGFDMRDESCN